jgi:predicted nucleotide-binding protein
LALEQDRSLVLDEVYRVYVELGPGVLVKVSEIAEELELDRLAVEKALHWLEGHKYIEWSSEGDAVTITASGIDAIEEVRQRHQAQRQAAKIGPPSSPAIDTSSLGSTPQHTIEPDPKKIWVVYGNDKLRKDFFSFLRALNLEPIEFSARLTGKGTPYIGQIVDALSKSARAAVVLFSPDDEARLKAEFRKPNDPLHEEKLTSQPRQNVLFETGLAFGRFGDERTILVRVGELRPFSDLFGRYEVLLGNDPETRQDLVRRLQRAGCEVSDEGSDWFSVGDFDAGWTKTRLLRRYRKARYPKVYAIDWSKPLGSLSYHRVIVVEYSPEHKQAFHMGQESGQDFDKWTLRRKVRLIPGKGDIEKYHEFLSDSGIVCTHKRPPSIDWLDRILKKTTVRRD